MRGTTDRTSPSSTRDRTRRCVALAVALGAVLAPAGAGAATLPARLVYVTGLVGTHPLVHVANGDGSAARQLGPGSDALLSPDGESVAIVSPYGRDGTSLAVQPAAGGPARTLSGPHDSIGQLAWSPDGSHLAAVANGSRLLVIDVASGAKRIVARGQLQGVSFSPQSDRIAYGATPSLRRITPVDVFVAQLDGSGAHAITHDGRSLYPLWGPTQIAFTHERLRRNDAPIFQLRVMDADGGGVRQLTHMRVPALLSGLTATAWSADGSRLLAEYGGQDTSEAWTVDVGSGRARDLTGRFDGVIGTGLAPDGQTVLVQRGYFDDPVHQSVATIPFGGGRATVLVAHGSAPSWGG